MSDLSDLQEIKSNMIARLKEVTAKPKANYSIDGQSVNWADYTEMLREQIKEITDLINLEEGPEEFLTISFT